VWQFTEGQGSRKGSDAIESTQQLATYRAGEGRE